MEDSLIDELGSGQDMPLDREEKVVEKRKKIREHLMEGEWMK